MERDAALVDGLYSAFARRDLDGIRGLVSDDVEFHNPDYAVEPGVRRGVDAFVQVIDRLHDMFDTPARNRCGSSGTGSTWWRSSACGAGRAGAACRSTSGPATCGASATARSCA